MAPDIETSPTSAESVPRLPDSRNPHPLLVEPDEACRWCDGTSWYARAMPAGESPPGEHRCDFCGSGIAKQVEWVTCHTCQGTARR